MEQEHHHSEQYEERKLSSLINIFVFCILTTGFGLLFFFLPEQKISDEEKRKLSEFPILTEKTIKSGDYMDSLDIYTADHFPFRTRFLDVATQLKKLRGYQNQNESFYNNIEAIDNLQSTNKKNSNEKESKTNSAGLLILNGKAFQLFNNNNPLTKQFEKLIKYYRLGIPTSVNLYVGIVPTSTDFYLTKNQTEFFNLENQNIANTYKQIKKYCTTIPIHQELKNHKKDYIYFNTDHHWTSLGAYFAYVAYCKSAHLNYIKLNEMKRKRVPNEFLGTHFLKTKDERLKKNPDSIIYWVPPTKRIALRYRENEEVRIKVFRKKKIKKNKYLVFLGGDEPLIVLSSKKIKNGKSVLVVKNSYGNPFVPYLTANYENVIVVDYRYAEKSILSLINEYNINDIIMLNSIYSANTKTHLDRQKDILKSNGELKNTFKKKKKREKNKLKEIKSDSLNTVIDTIKPIIIE
jgi:hypothetical protein